MPAPAATAATPATPATPETLATPATSATPETPATVLELPSTAQGKPGCLMIPTSLRPIGSLIQIPTRP